MYFGYVSSSFFYLIPPFLPTKSLLPRTYRFEEYGYLSPSPFTASRSSATGEASWVFPTLEGLLVAQGCASVNPAEISWMQQP